MTEEFLVTDVSLQAIVEIGRIVNISSRPLTKADLIKGLKGICGQSYIDRGLPMAIQLGFIEIQEDKTYKSSGKFQSDFTKISRNDLHILARKGLQSFPPFILFMENIKMGYDVNQSSQLVSGIFDLNSKIAAKFLPSAAIFCGLLSKENKIIDEDIKHNIDYVENLNKSLKDEFKATSLIISILSNEAYLYFSKKGIDFTRASKALSEIKKDPKDSLFKIFEFVESCLFNFGKEFGANVESTNGVSQLVQELRSKNLLLLNPTHLGTGLGGLRNMTNHGPDKETGKPWDFTYESVLGTALLAISYLKMVYLYQDKKQQEL